MFLAKNLEAVLFDHDGVLVASEPLHRAAWAKLLASLGISYHEQQLRAMVGKTAPQTLAYLLDLHRPGWDRTKYDLDALAQQKNHFYIELAQTQDIAYPGVREGLKWLKSQSIKTAVVSNARGRELRMILQGLGLLDQFDLVISRDEMAAPKPDARAYLSAAEQLGANPEHCLAIEDSPTGIESALRGGIPSAAVLTSFPKHVMESPVEGRPDLRPIWVGKSIRELFSWLERAR